MTRRRSDPTPGFPRTRLRRNRKTGWRRDLLAETSLGASDLILPLFVRDDDHHPPAIVTLPGVERTPMSALADAVEEAASLGVRAVALFPCVPDALKSEDARAAFDPDGLACRAVRAAKAAARDTGVICDVALDPYTLSGHDGLLRDGDVANDETVEALVRQALTLADAGADVLAPSDMMDGRVGAIRDALDAAVFLDVQIMAYAAKYASAFYGPFRDAVGSGVRLQGDKKSYQLDPRNSREALREVAFDIAEGADMVIVKPGLLYLDVLARVAERFDVPAFAYQVSGEFAMLKAAAAAGALDYDAALLETLTAFKRAGAAGVLTYGALDAARLLA